MTAPPERAASDQCGLDGVCSSCRESDLTPTGIDPVDDALAGRRRRHRAPEEWDTPEWVATVAALGLPGDDEADPEVFCGTCLAGMESSQHIATCPDGEVQRREAQEAEMYPADEPDTTNERSHQ